MGWWRYATSFWNVVDILVALVAIAWLHFITSFITYSVSSSPQDLNEILAFLQL